jgi:hypothetical protein
MRSVSKGSSGGGGGGGGSSGGGEEEAEAAAVAMGFLKWLVGGQMVFIKTKYRLQI